MLLHTRSLVGSIIDTRESSFRKRHAGAAPLAALLKEQDEMQGKEVGVILSGGNVDLHVYAAILAGKVSTLSPS